MIGSIGTRTEIDRITNALTGMTEAEAEAANARAIAKHKRKLPNIPIEDFVATLLSVKTEASKRSDVLELMPPAKMGDIGGLGELKAWVRKRAFAFGAVARSQGVDRPRGFLVVGLMIRRRLIHGMRLYCCCLQAECGLHSSPPLQHRLLVSCWYNLY